MQKHLSTSNSKYSIFKKVIFFILIIVVTGLGFQLIFEKKIILSSSSSGSYKINRILNTNEVDEIPIFGSSRVQGTYIPSILGSNYFNYGIDGTRGDVLLFFLEQECKKHKSNPFIIFNFELEGFSNSTGDVNNYILNCNNKDVRELIHNDYKFYYSIPFIKYFGNYTIYFKEYLNSKMMVTKYQDKGASIEKNILTKEKLYSLITERENTTTLFKNDSLLEHKFIKLFTENPSRKFIIIIPPYHPSYFKKFINYNDAENYLKNLSLKFKNITVLNYSHLNYPDEYYFNTSHLNYKGAIQFNNLIKDTLKIIIK